MAYSCVIGSMKTVEEMITTLLIAGDAITVSSGLAALNKSLDLGRWIYDKLDTHALAQYNRDVISSIVIHYVSLCISFVVLYGWTRSRFCSRYDNRFDDIFALSSLAFFVGCVLTAVSWGMIHEEARTIDLLGKDHGISELHQANIDILRHHFSVASYLISVNLGFKVTQSFVGIARLVDQLARSLK